jgi:hypothetical protein
MGLLLLLQLVRRHARLLDCGSGAAVDHFVLTEDVVCLCTGLSLSSIVLPTSCCRLQKETHRSQI